MAGLVDVSKDVVAGLEDVSKDAIAVVKTVCGMHELAWVVFGAEYVVFDFNRML